MSCFCAFLFLQRFGLLCFFQSCRTLLILAHVTLICTLLFHAVVSKLWIHCSWSRLRELWLQSGSKSVAAGRDVTEFYFVIFTCFIPREILSPAVSCLCSLQKFHFFHSGANELRSLITFQSSFFLLSLFSPYDKIPVGKKLKKRKKEKRTFN